MVSPSAHCSRRPYILSVVYFVFLTYTARMHALIGVGKFSQLQDPAAAALTRTVLVVKRPRR